MWLLKKLHLCVKKLASVTTFHRENGKMMISTCDSMQIYGRYVLIMVSHSELLMI